MKVASPTYNQLKHLRPKYQALPGQHCKGVRQDYQKAVEWYTKAANQGDADVQHLLGIMYKNGDGVPQNYKKAKEWYGKACDNGDQEGCDAYKDLNQRGF